MLRYYEAEGLLSPARTEQGYRDYAADDEDAVHRIRLLGRVGMTLASIREFLPCKLDRRDQFEPCDELKELLRLKIAEIDDQCRKLSESRALLGDLLVAFERSTPKAE